MLNDMNGHMVSKEKYDMIAGNSLLVVILKGSGMIKLLIISRPND